MSHLLIIYLSEIIFIQVSRITIFTAEYCGLGSPMFFWAVSQESSSLQGGLKMLGVGLWKNFSLQRRGALKNVVVIWGSGSTYWLRVFSLSLLQPPCSCHCFFWLKISTLIGFFHCHCFSYCVPVIVFFALNKAEYYGITFMELFHIWSKPTWEIYL